MIDWLVRRPWDLPASVSRDLRLWDGDQNQALVLTRQVSEPSDLILSFIKLAYINVLAVHSFVACYTHLSRTVLSHASLRRCLYLKGAVPSRVSGMLVSCALTHPCSHPHMFPPESHFSTLDTKEKDHLVSCCSLTPCWGGI